MNTKRKITILLLVIGLIALGFAIYFFSTSTNQALTTGSRASIINTQTNLSDKGVSMGIESQVDFIKQPDGTMRNLTGNQKTLAGGALGYGLRITLKNKSSDTYKVIYDANTDFCKGNGGKLYQNGNTFYCHMGYNGEPIDPKTNEHNLTLDLGPNESKEITLYRDSDVGVNCGSYQVDFAIKEVLKNGTPTGFKRLCGESPGCYPGIFETMIACPEVSPTPLPQPTPTSPPSPIPPTNTPVPPTATPVPVSCGGSQCNPAYGKSACTAGHECVQANNGQYYCSLPTTVAACKANPSAQNCCNNPAPTNPPTPTALPPTNTPIPPTATRVPTSAPKTPPVLTVEGPKAICPVDPYTITVKGSAGSYGSEKVAYQVWAVRKDHAAFPVADCPTGMVVSTYYCRVAEKDTPNYTAEAKGFAVGDYEIFTQTQSNGAILCSNNPIESHATKCANICL